MDPIITLDLQVFELLNGWHWPVLDRCMLLITRLGSGWVVAPLLTGAIVICRRARWRRAFLFGFAALTLSGLLTGGIKQTVRRPRPLGYVKKDMADLAVRIVGRPLTSRSFPSGHTTTAFAAATVATLLFGSTYGVYFIIAGLVGYSRIYLGVHFPLDVVAGALLGVVVVLAVRRMPWFYSLREKELTDDSR